MCLTCVCVREGVWQLEGRSTPPHTFPSSSTHQHPASLPHSLTLSLSLSSFLSLGWKCARIPPLDGEAIHEMCVRNVSTRGSVALPLMIDGLTDGCSLPRRLVSHSIADRTLGRDFAERQMHASSGSQGACVFACHASLAAATSIWIPGSWEKRRKMCCIAC